MALALLLEGLMILALFTLGESRPGRKDAPEALVSFTSRPDSEEPAKPEQENPDKSDTAQQQQPQQPPQPVPTPAAEPVAEPKPPAFIPLPRDQMASADIARPQPSSRAQGPVGPPNTPRPGDSQPLGATGPHGEPLYPARWYREPYDDELRGYLSTASGPGSALINCKTVAEFRVEDCVLVSEYPRGSNIGRAVLAAAWQFRVRPPRVGGVPQVGEWVRIRIDYEIRRP